MTTGVLRLRHQAAQSKIAFVQIININVKLVYSLLALCCLAMLVFYILTINMLTAGAYLIKSDTRQLQALLAENDSLQTNVAQASFLGFAQEKAQELNFEKTTNIKYVQILQNSLAVAK